MVTIHWKTWRESPPPRLVFCFGGGWYVSDRLRTGSIQITIFANWRRKWWQHSTHRLQFWPVYGLEVNHMTYDCDFSCILLLLSYSEFYILVDISTRLTFPSFNEVYITPDVIHRGVYFHLIITVFTCFISETIFLLLTEVVFMSKQQKLLITVLECPLIDSYRNSSSLHKNFSCSQS